MLAPGETPVVVCVGADRSQASIQHRYIEGVFQESPLLRPMLSNVTQKAIELTNGARIEVRSASYRRLRGVTAIAAICSEVRSD